MEFTRKKLACLFVLLLTYASSSRVTQQTQKWMTRLSPTSPRDQSTSQLKRVTNGVLVGLSTAALAINIRTPVLAVHAKSSTVRPSALEMKEVFNEEWINEDLPHFTKGDFRRLDESDDSNFYKITRFVEHIDAAAVAALTSFHATEIRNMHNLLSQQKKVKDDDNNKDKDGYQQPKAIRVLDLCSSWTSHLPTGALDMVGEVVGVGMNTEELAANKQLSTFYTIDLNRDPSALSSIRKRKTHSETETETEEIKDTFDLVLLQLSVDYLTNPVQVLQQAAALLTPHTGKILITFSNRVFIDKAVAIWTGKADIEHVNTVGDYLKASMKFQMPTTTAGDITPTGKNSRNGSGGDPLYVVSATVK